MIVVYIPETELPPLYPMPTIEFNPLLLILDPLGDQD